MNDAKDMEIARLKGQIEALEKQIARLSPVTGNPFAVPAVPFVQPTYVPPPAVAQPYAQPYVTLPYVVDERWRAGGTICTDPNLKFTAFNTTCGAGAVQ